VAEAVELDPGDTPYNGPHPMKKNCKRKYMCGVFYLLYLIKS